MEKEETVYSGRDRKTGGTREIQGGGRKKERGKKRRKWEEAGA